MTGVDQRRRRAPQDEELQDQAITDPVGLTVDLVTGVDPEIDPQTVRDVVARLAAGRAKARRLAGALAQRPAVLADGCSPAPLVVGELLVALRTAGAEVSAPVCARCNRSLHGSLARRGQDWCCHRCGRDRQRCTGCGHDRPVGRRDHHGRPYCIGCPTGDTNVSDPQAMLVGLISGLDPSLGATTITTALKRAVSRPADLQRLAWTVGDRPELLTGQGHQAPHPAVLRLIDELAAAGGQTIVRPACPGCGRIASLMRFQAGKRVCRRCSTAARAQACCRCSRRREPSARDQHGRPLCSRCVLNDPVNHQRCIRCGRSGPVESRTPDGPVCAACRPVQVLTCAICGRTGPAEISRVTGQPWCNACQQRWARCCRCGLVKPVRAGTLDEAPICSSCLDAEPVSGQRWQACAGCGAVERLARGPCPRCRLGERIRHLLADEAGAVVSELEPLRQALSNVERPATVLDWLRRSAAEGVLTELGRGTRPLTHATLDELGPNKTVEHLRSVLVAVGTLPQRDEQLVRLERWITTTLDAVPDPERRHLLQHYAVWHLLRRLRGRNRDRPTTYGQAEGIREHVRGAVLLLDGLAVNGRSLADCRQADLDRWLANDQARYRRQASGFVRWAVAAGHTTSRLQGLARTWTGPSELLDGEERWAQARRLIHDDTLALDDRVAGLLMLLYAQQASTISQLRADNVDLDTDVVRVHLGLTPVELPQPVAGLVRALVTTRTGHAVIGRPATTDWLFPGGRPGNPISAAHMGQRLRALGIRPNPARSAALFSLAAELPAAILARMLGIAIGVAVDWQHLTSGDWTSYAAEISRRTHVNTDQGQGASSARNPDPAACANGVPRPADTATS